MQSFLGSVKSQEWDTRSLSAPVIPPSASSLQRTFSHSIIVAIISTYFLGIKEKRSQSLGAVLSSPFHCISWIGHDYSVASCWAFNQAPGSSKTEIIKIVLGHLFCLLLIDSLFLWMLFQGFLYPDRRELPWAGYGCTVKPGACLCDVWSLMLLLCQLISDKKVRENTNPVPKHGCSHPLYGTLGQYLSLFCVNWQRLVSDSVKTTGYSLKSPIFP